MVLIKVTLSRLALKMEPNNEYQNAHCSQPW